MNWAVIFNRLFELIDQDGTPNYFSGPRFMRKVREVDQYFPTYQQFMDQRRASGKSTTRRDYYYDVLMSFPEPARVALVNSILGELDAIATAKATEIRAIFGGAVPGPVAVVPDHGWNASRLNEYLAQIDKGIATAEYERAVALAYTCLEGFYKAFVARCIPESANESEIIALAKAIKKYLSQTIGSYPDEALNMVTHIHTYIDDFRTGYCALSYLSTLPVAGLKIDRSFVEHMVEDERQEAIVATIITMAHSLDLIVVAEGVENTRQLAALKRLGCDEAQGYLLGMPSEAE